MKGFRQESPEVPVSRRIAHPVTRVTLDGMIQIREFERIAQEKYRGVVADEIPVAFISVEFHGEATDIALCISGSAFSGYSGKSYKARCLFAYF